MKQNRRSEKNTRKAETGRRLTDGASSAQFSSVLSGAAYRGAIISQTLLPSADQPQSVSRSLGRLVWFGWVSGLTQAIVIRRVSIRASGTYWCVKLEKLTRVRCDIRECKRVK